MRVVVVQRLQMEGKGEEGLEGDLRDLQYFSTLTVKVSVASWRHHRNDRARRIGACLSHTLSLFLPELWTRRCGVVCGTALTYVLT